MAKFGSLDDVERMCSWCGDVKSASDFRVSNNRYGNPQRSTACRPCESLRAMKRQRAITPERAAALREARASYVAELRATNCAKKRDRHLQKKYGISHSDYEQMLDAQGGVCAICKVSEPQNQSKGRMNVDHCHSTGLVRGLLCDRCNKGLGAFADNIDLLLTAVSYLSKSQFTQEEF